MLLLMVYILKFALNEIDILIVKYRNNHFKQNVYFVILILSGIYVYILRNNSFESD